MLMSAWALLESTARAEPGPSARASWLMLYSSSAVSVANLWNHLTVVFNRSKMSLDKGKRDCTCTVWVKKNPPPLGDLTFFHLFHKRMRICNRCFTHLLNVHIFARLQILIQLSPILTKLCHIKRDYAVHIICAKCPKRARSDICVSRW